MAAGLDSGASSAATHVVLATHSFCGAASEREIPRKLGALGIFYVAVDWGAMETSRDIEPLTHAEAVRLAQRYVAAYNDRDLEAMLDLQHEDVVSYPSRLFGVRQITGRDGVRAWWEQMVASGRWYEVVVDHVRQIGPDRVAILGEVRDRGERLVPWGVIARVRDGLIIESHSYLSDGELLESLGLLEEPRVPS